MDFLLSALITGPLSNRSLSQSYKLEGVEPKQLCSSLFHFLLHKRTTGTNTERIQVRKHSSQAKIHHSRTTIALNYKKVKP